VPTLALTKSTYRNACMILLFYAKNKQLHGYRVMNQIKGIN